MTRYLNSGETFEALCAICHEPGAEIERGLDLICEACANEITNSTKTQGEFMTNAQYRQGDVFLCRVDSIPADLSPVARDKGRVILAYGEVTGHAHAIRAKNVSLFRDPKLAKVFMLVGGDKPIPLAHEEHSTIDLPPGNYEVIIQREYHPEAIRNVAD